MGIFDVIFGKTRLPKSRSERLFAMSTAFITITTNLGWKASNRAGICLKLITTGDFNDVEKELVSLVELTVGDTGTKLALEKDEYGYRWFIFEDEDFEDLVTLVHVVAKTLEEKGYGTQLLSAVFRFSPESIVEKAYLIYNYKRGTFYPFVPKDKSRDNSSELRVSAVLEKELPIEKELERWYALWECPV